jgi:hypothetical protein
MNNWKIFCLSIYNKNSKFFRELNYTPVGLGKSDYDKDWILDKSEVNISHKNCYYGEYTFHYWIWKNYLENLKKQKWIGFSTYRRFWTTKDCSNSSIEDFKKNIITKPPKDWDNAEVILVQKFTIGKIKKSKIIKNFGVKNTLLNCNFLFKSQHNLYEHFQIFHGSYYIDEAIKLLPYEDKNGFREYMQNYSFNPFNLFICRNSKILEEYYKNIFSWLSRCENKFDMTKLQGYQIRMLAFLAEYYLSYWFKKKFSVVENPISFFDTNKKI